MSENTRDQDQEHAEALTAQEVQDDPKEQHGCIEVETPDPEAEPDAKALAELSERLKPCFDTAQYEALKSALQPLAQMQAKPLSGSISTLQTGFLSNSMRALETLQQQMLSGMVEPLKGLSETLNNLAATMQTPLQAHAAAAAHDAIKGMTAFFNSDKYRTFKAGVSAIAATLERRRAELEALAGLPEGAGDLLLFLSAELEELEEAQQPAELDGCTLIDILEQGLDDDGNPIDGPFREIIERAKQRKADFEATEGIIETAEETIVAAEELPRIQYKKTTEIKTITDKLSNVFYSLMAPAAPQEAVNGQRQMIPLRYEGRKSKKEVTLLYDYIYNEEILEKYGLNKKFDDFDFFVMTIIDSLYEAGNDVVSFTKIYKEMGGEGSPSSKQLEQIYHSLLKGMTTIITIDDSEVQEAWHKGAATYREIVSPVIPVQIGNERFIASGRITSGFVRINGVSPMMQVAKPIGHITAWEKSILKLYKGRRTKRFYSVMRFLMLNIGWMRNGKRSRKISYSSLYQHTGDKSRRAQQLSRGMMYRLLDEVFKPGDYITAYKEEADPEPGVVLTLSKKRLKGGARQ